MRVHAKVHAETQKPRNRAAFSNAFVPLIDVAESVIGHMIPGVAGVYNRHQYDEQRVEWLRRLSERLEELARPG